MRRLFDSSDLRVRSSLRFPLNAKREGFALRLDDGTVRGYVNVCPHRGQPVDVGDGRLFLADGSIECQAHGARFEAQSGRCLGGPCTQSLTMLPLGERDGAVFLRGGEDLAQLGGDPLLAATAPNGPDSIDVMVMMDASHLLDDDGWG